jgi:hypothetical protein
MRLADDYPAIAQRLRQIQQERGNGSFALPPGVRIMIWESWENSQLTAREVMTMDLCLMLRQQVVVLVKSRTSSFVTSGGVDMIAFLRRHFPSIRQSASRQYTLSKSDADQLRSMIDHTPW